MDKPLPAAEIHAVSPLEPGDWLEVTRDIAYAWRLSWEQDKAREAERDARSQSRPRLRPSTSTPERLK